MSAVVLIPAPFYGDYPEHSHLTLVWPGSETPEQTLRALINVGHAIAESYYPFEARCGGLTYFGPARDEPVILVELHEHIRSMRAMLDHYESHARMARRLVRRAVCVDG